MRSARRRTFALRRCSVDMDAGLLFQNAKVKSREMGLLGADRLQRISDAATIEEAMRLLAEANYPSGASYDEVLSSAEREAALLFKSCMTKGYGLELFLIMDDYHNAKVAAKSAYLGGSKDGYKPEGYVTIAALEEALSKGEYKELPQGIADSFAALDKVKARDALTPSAVDITLDRAAFEEIQAKRKGTAKVIGRYFDLLADLKNISVAYRAYKAGFSAEKAKEMLLPAGTLVQKDLLKIAVLGEEAADKISAETVVKEALSALKEGVTAYEVFMDNTLLSLLKKERYDMFSPAPIAGLYIGKLREIKNVRLILARIANGVDKEVIKGRMRELYV